MPPGDGWENSTESLQLRGISEAIALDPSQLHRAELGLWHSDITRLTDSETMSLDELVDRGHDLNDGVGVIAAFWRTCPAINSREYMMNLYVI